MDVLQIRSGTQRVANCYLLQADRLVFEPSASATGKTNR